MAGGRAEYSDGPEVYVEPPKSFDPNPQSDAHVPIPPHSFGTLTGATNSTSDLIHAEKTRNRKRKILGLPQQAFCAIIALCVLVVVAAIGGGIGGYFAVRNARRTDLEHASSLNRTLSCPPTNTTRDNYAAVAPSLVARLVTPKACFPQFANGNWNTTARFIRQCATDLYGNDIAVTIAYSFQDCIDACTTLNAAQGYDTCIAVSFSALMAKSVKSKGGNCFLKSSQTEVVANEDSTAAKLCKDITCTSTF